MLFPHDSPERLRMYISNLLLKRLYTYGSLKNEDVGVCLSDKNRLKDARLIEINRLIIDDQEVPLSTITFWRSWTVLGQAR
jgi:hypothetical protein